MFYLHVFYALNKSEMTSIKNYIDILINTHYSWNTKTPNVFLNKLQEGVFGICEPFFSASVMLNVKIVPALHFSFFFSMNTQLALSSWLIISQKLPGRRIGHSWHFMNYTDVFDVLYVIVILSVLVVSGATYTRIRQDGFTGAGKLDCLNGPFTRYVKLRIVHAPGMPGTSPPPRRRFQTKPLASDSGIFDQYEKLLRKKNTSMESTISGYAYVTLGYVIIMALRDCYIGNVLDRTSSQCLPCHAKVYEK